MGIALMSSLPVLDVYESALPGAAVHNGMYRGKNLGASVTAEQYAAISNGSFKDLFIGDYWVIDSVNWRIAAFDYWLNCGDTPCTDHHILIVPDTCLYNTVFNSTNTTANGYLGSQLNMSGLAQANETIINTFNRSHVMSRRIYLTTQVTNGVSSNGDWFNESVSIMCEQMVYGSGIFSPVSNGSNVPANYRVEKSQLPLFRHEPSRICNRDNWWLRDVITASAFALINGDGLASCDNASNSLGIRPYFCIK